MNRRNSRPDQSFDTITRSRCWTASELVRSGIMFYLLTGRATAGRCLTFSFFLIYYMYLRYLGRIGLGGIISFVLDLDSPKK